MAERLASEAQSILDGSTRHLGELATDLKAAEILADVRSEPDLATRVFSALRLKHPGMDLDELTHHGQAVCRVASGGEAARGSAVDFLTVRLVSNAYLDPTALEAKLRELATATFDRERIPRVADMTDAIDDFGIARRDLFEALTQFEQIAAYEDDPTVIARRFSKTVGELYEAALPLFAWCQLLLGTTESADAYQRLVTKDSTELTTRLGNKLPRTFGDFPTFLRNAGHHGRAFQVDDSTGTVTIRLRSHTESMTIARYVDRAYALLESLLVVHWTVSNWLEQAAVTVPMPSGAAEAMGLTQQQLAAFWLREVRGLEITESTLRDGRWTIAGEVPEGEVLTLALAMAQLADNRCHVVEVRASDTAGAPLTVSLKDYQAFATTAGGSRGTSTLGLLMLRHRCTSQGECLLQEMDTEFAAVALGFAVLNGEFDQVAHLRSVRQLAISHGHSQVAGLATRALATIRNGDDFDLKLELAARTKTFAAPEPPTASAAEVRLDGGALSPRRPCD
ncbi:hypothetical protein KEC57_04525 [Microbacterium sp. BWT-G7]|uniref:Uncharacterized protein n=2 Tax=Microbacterium allomyrinae TaxID=2830666 RepID=A0A9X1LTX9_9MICO|nr:hypothetical protein [Microbacterium allomyrinae]